MASSDGRQLSTVQAARGAAAMVVVLAHAGTILGSSDALGYVPMRGIFRAGHAGVDFFFVLSGFIIMLVHHGDIGRPRVCLDYAWKRCTRIFPMYWIALAVLTLTVSAGLAQGVELTNVWTAVTLFLWPQHHSPPLGVSWTLQHEMLFYLVFGVAILSRRLGMVALCVWLTLTVGGLFRENTDLPWAAGSLLWDFVASPYHLQFLLGIAVAAVVVADRVPRPRTLLAIGVVGIACTAAIEDLGAIAYLGAAGQSLFGGFSALAIAGMATAERRGLLSAGAPAVLGGEASYTIYLVHIPAIAVVHCMLVRSGLLLILPGWLIMVALAVAGAFAGIGLHLVVERPILRFLRGIRSSGRGSRAAVAEVAPLA